MTGGNLDRYGEPLEDDVEIEVQTRRRSPRDEIHSDRCAELRAILAEARARREAQR